MRVLSISKGAKVGGYKIRFGLGSGGYGSVWEASPLKNPRSRVSIKFLSDKCDNQRTGRTAMLRKQFWREIEFLKLCSSRWSFLPRFIESGIFNDVPYYVMECLEPYELPRKEVEIRRFAEELLAAISTLHEAGFVHCDLKPENIMRRRESDALVIVDFGTVHKIVECEWRGKKRDSVSIDSVGKRIIFGTNNYIDYASVEENPHSVQRDIFAFGQILRDCFGDEVPSEWNKIIDRCKVVGREAGCRYASIREVQDAVSALDESKRKIYEQGRRNYLTNKRIEQREMAEFRKVEMDWRDAAVITDRSSGTRYIVMDFNLSVRPELKRLSVSFKRPIKLKRNEVLKIIGPVIIDADISGAKGSSVILSHVTILHNHTTVPQPRNGVTYILGGGTYLDFVNLSEQTFAASCDGRQRIFRSLTAATHLAYGGPRTVAGIVDNHLVAVESSDLSDDCKSMLTSYYKGETLFLQLSEGGDKRLL